MLLTLIQDLAEFDIVKHEFKANLRWFEEEFDELFLLKAQFHSQEDIKVANEILDIFSSMINDYHEEKLLNEVVSSLNKIEENHPALF